MAGHAMGNEMSVNTWAALAGGDDHAIVDGDFATLEGELQGVLKALRTVGINIVAIHQHMTHGCDDACSSTASLQARG